MIRKSSLLLLFILPLLGYGQQESYYSLYRYNMNVINPAFAEGMHQYAFFTLRSQWASVQDAPRTLAFAYSSARENNVGLGLSLVSIKYL